MKYIAPVIAFLGLATSVVMAVENRILAVEGVVLLLNQPGTIVVEISIGSDDGLKMVTPLSFYEKTKKLGSSQSRSVNLIGRQQKSSMCKMERHCELAIKLQVNRDGCVFSPATAGEQNSGTRSQAV